MVPRSLVIGVVAGEPNAVAAEVGGMGAAGETVERATQHQLKQLQGQPTACFCMLGVLLSASRR